ncbi:MAG: hypothetical protein JSV50_12155 [Desulfobacteraceae bacterium]|nr:MAG: hypothetical protein JSV50_12155 [Desulfobacteraceae bacterium]
MASPRHCQRLMTGKGTPPHRKKLNRYGCKANSTDPEENMISASSGIENARLARLTVPCLTTSAVTRLQKIIYEYYHEHGRALPWRATDDPYHIFVSEIMLQQTQVERVMAKYEQFVAAFPCFFSLAHATLREILKVWQGMGYNRRAQALKKSAELVMEQFHGQLPSSPEELMTLPGVGRTTASAIAAFAFQEPTVFVETNIRTVFIHFFFRHSGPVKDSEIIPLVARTLDTTNPRKWYYALMDYGVMLKKKHQNPSRKSAHYKKQGPFKGSNREIRGMILRVLLAKPHCSERELTESLSVDPERVNGLLTILQKEGFVKKTGTRFAIAHG